ncbi:MAG: hypothetical protein WCI34_01585 [Actinomycetes bacterium]
MSVDQPVQVKAQPASEEIHLPGPSAIPLVTAIAITLVVIGLGLSLWITAVGAVLLVGCLTRWIGDTRRSVAELPEATSGE